MTLSYKTALSLDGALAAQGTGPKTTLAHYTFRRQVIRLPNNNYMKKHVMYFLVLLLAALRVDAQSFQNLNFESATLSPTQGAQPWPDYVPIVSGLPDWTAYLGSVQQTQSESKYFYPRHRQHRHSRAELGVAAGVWWFFFGRH